MGVTRGGLQVGGSRRRGGEFKSKAYPSDLSREGHRLPVLSVAQLKAHSLCCKISTETMVKMGLAERKRRKVLHQYGGRLHFLNVLG